VCSRLWARGHLRIHATDAERLEALADEAVAGLTATGRRQPVLVMADTHEQVTALNAAIRDRLVAAGMVDDRQTVTTRAGERLGVGDRVATRRNDRDLDVANRDTWTVTGLGEDGGLTVAGRTGTRDLPAAYAREQVELAYATTVYGAQGETVGAAHLMMGEHTTGAAVYVGMTRGRDHNTVHVVAEAYDEARDQWVAAFHREPADLGPGNAARRAAGDVEQYGPLRPLTAALGQLRAGWDAEHELGRAIRSTTAQRDRYAEYGHVAADRVAEIDVDLNALQARLTQVRQQIRATLREPALQALPADRLTAEHRSWRDRRDAVVLAARLRQQQPQRARRNQIPVPAYQRGPDRGHGIGL
jgi:hypothetical protein